MKYYWDVALEWGSSDAEWVNMLRWIKNCDYSVLDLVVGEVSDLTHWCGSCEFGLWIVEESKVGDDVDPPQCSPQTLTSGKYQIGVELLVTFGS